jgi:sugar lactone lactonase YvrE
MVQPHMKRNMKTLLLGTGIVLSISCLASVGQTQAAPQKPIKWEVSAGLEAPESVYFEASSGVLFVSNIGKGGPTAKDGSGYISKLTLEGKMIEPKWVAGLNAPKGLRSHNGILWVSDIDRLVGIDIAKGEIRHKIEAEGAQFLNDVATDREGAVYVSDMLANKIYRYKEGKLSVLAEGDHLESPNGLLVHGNRLVVAGWGLGIQEDFGTQTPGRLFSLNLNGEDKRLITPEPTGNLDGVEAMNDQGFLVSDWYAGKVYFIEKGGKTELLLQLPRGAADLAYLPQQRLLIVPQMLENKVSAFEFPVRGN